MKVIEVAQDIKYDFDPITINQRDQEKLMEGVKLVVDSNPFEVEIWFTGEQGRPIASSHFPAYPAEMIILSNSRYGQKYCSLAGLAELGAKYLESGSNELLP